eukprot:CAMPEP_0198130766 /NCGR_PEP_ID=MMETSP1442-20131203/54656_1 /TAXON_ID= /ORGANISM="Craspedostauros australis, Strain CCMP3328" /LENGTH=52 /DNA_ID=CAMNT_0043791451 /DNA_START=16 /DNA_END=170 /DNA_ORIENTATION=-
MIFKVLQYIVGHLAHGRVPGWLVADQEGKQDVDGLLKVEFNQRLEGFVLEER